MGLKDKLSNQGSKYTYTAGEGIAQLYPIDYSIIPNILSTNLSPLHYNQTVDKRGWSTKGYQSYEFPITIKNYNLYKDGVENALPYNTALSPILNDVDEPILYISQTFK